MEYVKDNKKNVAKGIRFNGVQLNIALGKAKKKSAQQLIDFLIDRFVNGENPILERQPQVYDAPRVNTHFTDEPKQWQEPEQIKNWQYYMNKISTIKDIDDCKELDLEIRNSGCLPNEKKILIDNLVTHSKTLYND